MLEQLQSIGRGLDAEGFQAGLAKHPIEVLGVQISIYNSSTFDARGQGSTRFVLDHPELRVFVLMSW